MRSTPPIHPVTLALMDAIGKIELKIKSNERSFISPVWEKHSNPAEWGEYAHKMSTKKLNPSVIFLFNQLKHLYEAARLLANSRQLSLEMSMQYLKMSCIFKELYSEDVLNLKTVWDQCKADFCRLDHLKEILLSECSRCMDGMDIYVYIYVYIYIYISK
jgi:hypothetical protein